MHEPRERLYIPLRRLGLVFLLAVSMVGALALPAFAQSDRDSDGPRVVITGRVDVGARERTDSVVIFDGNAVIDGNVHGSVVAFHGDVLVRGHVDSNVVAVNGRVAIASSATVGGSVASSERPLVDPGARIDGDIHRANFRNFFRALGWALWLGWWLAVSISLFVLGVVLLAIAPRMFPPILEVARTARRSGHRLGIDLGDRASDRVGPRDDHLGRHSSRTDRPAVARAALQRGIRGLGVAAGPPPARRAAQRDRRVPRRSADPARRRLDPRAGRTRHRRGDGLRRGRSQSRPGGQLGPRRPRRRNRRAAHCRSRGVLSAAADLTRARAA